MDQLGHRASRAKEVKLDSQVPVERRVQEAPVDRRDRLDRQDHRAIAVHPESVVLQDPRDQRAPQGRQVRSARVLRALQPFHVS